MGGIVHSLLKRFFTAYDAKKQQQKNAIYAITRLRPGNFSLYKLALQHSSVKQDQNANERLEFLGDAVLSLIIGEYLFKKYPYKAEGFLTEIRARIVNRASLSNLAQKIGISALLLYDRNAIRKGSAKVIYGNALEALIGAVYLDKGYRRCRKFVLDQLLHLYIDLDTLIQTDTNYKSQLITWADRNRQAIQFKIVSEQRSGHCSIFVAHVAVDGHVTGQGQGSSKKQAEQRAAQDALATLSIAD